MYLGNIDIVRDWGWSPEYVRAMWMMPQQEKPDDFVIATGKSRNLKEFLELAFMEVGLDWRRHVLIDPNLYRPTDLAIGKANPRKVREKLGWNAQYHMEDVVKMLVTAELDGAPCS